jgi:hypothetical protein
MKTAVLYALDFENDFTLSVYSKGNGDGTVVTSLLLSLENKEVWAAALC